MEMTRIEIVELLNVVFQICELELLIKEYDDKMKILDNGLGECNQGAPKAPGT